MNQRDSILTSIKKLLGIAEDYTHFDTDIIIHINTALMTLTQLGVGPASGFAIEDKQDFWDDFLDNIEQLESVRTYVYLKVKLVFDPPLNATVISSMQQTINELEWRLNVAVDTQ